MSPEYLNELADIADPDKLWRFSGLEQRALPVELKRQLDTGVALRRYASRMKELDLAFLEHRSLLETKLGPSHFARMTVDTPYSHESLRPGYEEPQE